MELVQDKTELLALAKQFSSKHELVCCGTSSIIADGIHFAKSKDRQTIKGFEKSMFPIRKDIVMNAFNEALLEVS